MLTYTHTHRVRYREVDPMGIVYHTHYLDYFEVARTELLRSFGLPYKEVEDAGVIMPVVEATIQYRRPARYDDLLAITARVEEMPDMRVTVAYEITRDGESEILTTGTVTLCFVDVERGRPVRAPDSFRQKFEQAFQEPSAHQV